MSFDFEWHLAIVFHIALNYSYIWSDICTLSLMIGHRIREARKLRGYNQQWLAEQIGVSQPSVSDWESGRNDPTMDNLAMARACWMCISNGSPRGAARAITPIWLASTPAKKRKESTCTRAGFRLRRLRARKRRNSPACSVACSQNSACSCWACCAACWTQRASFKTKSTLRIIRKSSPLASFFYLFGISIKQCF